MTTSTIHIQKLFEKKKNHDFKINLYQNIKGSITYKTYNLQTSF